MPVEFWADCRERGGLAQLHFTGAASRRQDNASRQRESLGLEGGEKNKERKNDEPLSTSQGRDANRGRRRETERERQGRDARGTGGLGDRGHGRCCGLKALVVRSKSKAGYGGRPVVELAAAANRRGLIAQSRRRRRWRVAEPVGHGPARQSCGAGILAGKKSKSHVTGASERLHLSRRPDPSASPCLARPSSRCSARRPLPCSRWPLCISNKRPRRG